jgi:hypothetical protein
MRYAAILMFVAAAAAAAVPSCKPGNMPTPIADIIECSKVANLPAEFAKLSALVPDWAAIYATAVADVKSLGVAVVGCVLADLTQQYLIKKGPSAPPADTQNARDTFERFRVEQAHNATFATSAGNL